MKYIKINSVRYFFCLISLKRALCCENVYS